MHSQEKALLGRIGSFKRLKEQMKQIHRDSSILEQPFKTSLQL